MRTHTPLFALATAAALLGAAGGTTALAQSQAGQPAATEPQTTQPRATQPRAQAAAPSARAIDGDVDVHGARLTLEAETPLSATKVTFLYNGQRIAARLTETDREDRTKDWEATTAARRADRRPGALVTFRVRACDSSGCTTVRIRERD